MYTENDVNHTFNAAKAVQLKSPASYVDIEEIARLVAEHNIDAVHPGYGFLSESAPFATKLAEMNVLLVGPGAENLHRTGDKLQARQLAQGCSVPVLPAFTTPTGNVEEVKKFAQQNGFPIMVKAVDGGGGRGIRLIRGPEDLQSLVTRAIEESPSKQVFAEKAAVDGFRHVEIQIIGDGKGNVMHLWERECSIQRRYQKVVELAPSTVSKRSVVAPLIDSAVRIAKKVPVFLHNTNLLVADTRQIRYASLGTFEFLLNPHTGDFYFLEINPRLQVEHTITESICAVDIVKAQLRIAQGATFEEAGLDGLHQNPLEAPKQFSIQLRLTAEDPQKGYSLSIGKIQSFSMPSGAGIRVDTALRPGVPTLVTSDFDSVIAKIIVTARTWPDVVSRARRSLEDTTIAGVTTNLALLKAIIAHPDFEAKNCDTQWLEGQHQALIEEINRESISRNRDPLHGLVGQQGSSTRTAVGSAGNTLFRKDDAWQITLGQKEKSVEQKHHLQLTKVLRNDFPDNFAAEILYTTPGNQPTAYTMELKTTSASGAAMNSQHRQGSRSDPSHVILPISGKLVEVLVDAGDIIQKDDPVCVIKQMKMEVEIRSHRAGRVSWVTEAEDGEDVAEGMLAAVVEDERTQSKL